MFQRIDELEKRLKLVEAENNQLKTENAVLKKEIEHMRNGKATVDRGTTVTIHNEGELRMGDVTARDKEGSGVQVDDADGGAKNINLPH